MKDVAEAAAENGNLLAVTLGELRETLGYNRLGTRVLAEIANELNDAGLGYFPAWVLDENDVPRFGNELRVYTKDSNLARLIEAIVEPSDHGDERLRDASVSSGGAASAILDRIKEIVNSAAV